MREIVLTELTRYGLLEHFFVDTTEEQDVAVARGYGGHAHGSAALWMACPFHRLQVQFQHFVGNLANGRVITPEDPQRLVQSVGLNDGGGLQSCGAGEGGDTYPVGVIMPSGHTEAIHLHLGFPVRLSPHEVYGAVGIGRSGLFDAHGQRRHGLDALVRKPIDIGKTLLAVCTADAYYAFVVVVDVGSVCNRAGQGKRGLVPPLLAQIPSRVVELLFSAFSGRRVGEVTSAGNHQCAIRLACKSSGYTLSALC